MSTPETEPPTDVAELDAATKEKREAIVQVAIKALDESKQRCIMAFSFYVFVLIIIGLPLWWITTSPYRASLEYFDDFQSEESVHFNYDTQADVWNQIPVSHAYNVHLIFVHRDLDNFQWVAEQKAIKNEINRMINYLSDTMFISVTSEHLWDMFMERGSAALKNIKLSGGEASNFITAIDKRSTPIASHHPLLKFVFVLADEGFEVEGSKNIGQTFASWGSIISVTHRNKVYLNAIYESFHSLLGAPNECLLNQQCPHPNHEAWDRYRDHALAENIFKTKHYINAIKKLAATIPHLVITEEVGQLVRKSKALVVEAIKEQSSIKAATARMLAEKAADHESLIGTGDLMWSLKFGIYIPIAMPLLIPLIEVVLRYLWAKFQTRHIKTD